MTNFDQLEVFDHEWIWNQEYPKFNSLKKCFWVSNFSLGVKLKKKLVQFPNSEKRLTKDFRPWKKRTLWGYTIFTRWKCHFNPWPEAVLNRWTLLWSFWTCNLLQLPLNSSKSLFCKNIFRSTKILWKKHSNLSLNINSHPRGFWLKTNRISKKFISQIFLNSF